MYATQTHRTPKSLFNFLMPDPLKGRLDNVSDKLGTPMAQLVRSFVESGVEELEQRLNTRTEPSSQSGNWSVSPKAPTTDYGEPLAIFANEKNNDW